MKKQDSAESLNNVFSEMESLENSNSELDKSLKDVGINPDELVKNELKKIKAFFEKNEKESGLIQMNKKDTFLLATTKNKTDLNKLKRKLDNKKSKDQ